MRAKWSSFFFFASDCKKNKSFVPVPVSRGGLFFLFFSFCQKNKGALPGSFRRHRSPCAHCIQSSPVPKEFGAASSCIFVSPCSKPFGLASVQTARETLTVRAALDSKGTSPLVAAAGTLKHFGAWLSGAAAAPRTGLQALLARDSPGNFPRRERPPSLAPTYVRSFRPRSRGSNSCSTNVFVIFRTGVERGRADEALPRKSGETSPL